MKMPWDLKHIPNLDEFIFDKEDTRRQLTSLDVIPNMLLSGPPGTGKTTLSKLLIAKHVNEFDVLVINASDENGVDTIREKIKNFVLTNSLGDYKVILLDEADYLSEEAQAILRVMMNDHADTARFILTCNYVHKISEPIQSRCGGHVYEMKTLDKLDVAERIITILIEEGIKFTLDDVNYYINKLYPDFRKIIKSIESNCVNNVLKINAIQTFDALQYIESNNWIGLRSALLQRPDIDPVTFFDLIFDNLHLSEKFKDSEKYDAGILVLADYVKNNKGLNPYILMSACAIELMGI